MKNKNTKNCNIKPEIKSMNLKRLYVRLPSLPSTFRFMPQRTAVVVVAAQAHTFHCLLFISIITSDVLLHFPPPSPQLTHGNPIFLSCHVSHFFFGDFVRFISIPFSAVLEAPGAEVINTKQRYSLIYMPHELLGGVKRNKAFLKTSRAVTTENHI